MDQEALPEGLGRARIPFQEALPQERGLRRASESYSLRGWHEAALSIVIHVGGVFSLAEPDGRSSCWEQACGFDVPGPWHALIWGRGLPSTWLGVGCINLTRVLGIGGSKGSKREKRRSLDDYRVQGIGRLATSTVVIKGARSKAHIGRWEIIIKQGSFSIS